MDDFLSKYTENYQNYDDAVAAGTLLQCTLI